MDEDVLYAEGPSVSMRRDTDANSNKEDNHEDMDKISETNDDLYDEVLTGSVDWDSDKAPPKNKAEGKKDQADLTGEDKKNNHGHLSLYVGHFPWWVSDNDIIGKARSLGVDDVVDIKFAENKANGQSRGYAELTVMSEKSFRMLIEKLPGTTLSGEKIECRYVSRHNYSFFHNVAQQRFPMRAHSISSRETHVSNLEPPKETGHLTTPPPPFVPPPLVNPFPSQPCLYPGHLVPPFPLMPPNIPPPIPPLFPPPMPQMSSHQPPPSLHLNPAFLPPRLDRNMHQMMDHEFEDLINRNRAVASSAITKAVTGATTGDHQESMETLLTAIAIIKQSRVYSDSRCQALVTSLKDCLVSIQGNGTHRKSSFSEDERDRVRDRDRERDRDRKHSSSRDGAGGSRRHRYRDRSRSRERDRGRSRGHSREHSREQGRHREYREHHR